MDEAIDESEGHLLDRFEAVVRSVPDAVALDHLGEHLAYRELDVRANRLAHQLTEHGVGPEDVVAVCLGRGPDAITALLAVLKAGAAYLPLDPALPPQRLAHMIQDAGTRLVLTASTHTPALPTGDLPVLHHDKHTPDRHPATPPDVPRDRDALAYVVYTSGTTGVPKGIAATWHTLHHVIRFAVDEEGPAADEPLVCPQFASLGFDVSLLEIFTTLLRGGRLLLIPEVLRHDPDGLLDLLADRRATRMYLPPAMLDQLAVARADRPVDLALTRLCLSGEALSLHPGIRELLSALPGVVLENQYGPSETHHATSALLTGDPGTWPTTPPIGHPLPGLHIHLLDHRLNPVPPGVPGELYITGPTLARGYLGQPALTAQRFTASPFHPGTRMYRTGDLAQWTHHGTLTYLGRTDDQIKIRGHRIEPAEIETTLTTHPHITHATVHLRHDQPHHPHLTAYLVPTEGEECPGPGDLHAFLRSRLPAYMVPTAFVLVDAVPLTRNGKVDRLRLPAPAQEHRPSGAGAAPENGTERAIADIWRELFGTEGIGVEDDFFDLGGHSLIATRIVSRLRAAVDPAVSVRDLFEHRTVRALAAAVRAAEPSSGTGRVLPRAAGTGELSFAQRRLWFFDQLSPGSATYNVTVAWRVGGRIDPQVLARALREICERHEVLRTSFAESEGRPYPVVSPSAAFVLETEDLRGAEDEAVRRVQRLAVKPFDLNAGPLLRVQLFKVAEDRHRLALHLHHIVVDGWSMDVLWKELSALYDAYAAGLPSPLPPPAIQYADYAAWQNAWLESEPVREQLRYWTGALAGAPESPVLPSRPRPKVRSGRGRTHRFTVPAETAEALGAVGRAHGATPFMVFLTAFHVLLARYTGGSDIVTGSPVAGRVRPESEELIGFFVNAMALRLRWSGDPAFSELLARARATVLDAQRHQDIPFDRVVEELGPERDLSRNPVFQIFFAYNAADDHPTPAGWSVERADTDPGLARFDLELELEEGPEGVRGALCYSTDLFEPSTVRGLAEHFVTLCAGIAADPGRTVSGLPLLDETERDRILRVWNEQEERGEPRADEGHPLDRFEAVVRAAPDAVALDHLGEHLAYRELDVRANRLAHRIAEQGVGPEDVVAVCLGRGPDAITALLAVLKAGAAYLPLDPALPVRRLAHMLQDAGTRLVLTASAHTAALPAGDLPVLLVDGRASGRHPATPPDVPRDRDALAYVVYTSGTTGVPKGIAVTWRTLDHVIRFDGHRERTRGIAPRSCAQLASLSFDVSLQEVFVTLLRAGRLVLVGDEARRDPDRLLELLSEREVERVYLSPAQLDQLAVSWSERPSALAVRHVSAGGEALRLGPEAVELLSALPGVVLENQYGPSETHHATSALLTGDPGTWPTTPPIGHPLPGLHIHLLDHRLNPVPPGVPGELYITGPTLARGYLGQPALTAQRFTASPFHPGTRMYRTGDLAQWTHHGTLTYLGRTDDQIKIRGHRIEPAEIETTLTTHPHITHATVHLRHDQPHHPHLTAYLVPTDPGTLDLAAVRAHLARFLPDYMVPSALVPIDRLPLNANGKVDVRALPRPRPAAAARRRPRSMREGLLCELFAEVLGVDAVGVDQNFFDLGGHSLLVPRLISRIRSALGVELPIRRLFDAPTAGGLAAALDERVAGRQVTSGLETLFPLRTAGTGVPLFCVHPAAGISWCYAGLPRLLGRGVPVYGLQDPGLADPARLPGSVEEMAAGYVEHIRAVRPHGPYHLLGWSFGGLVAQEAAVRLQEQGEEVGLLCLLDSYPRYGMRDGGRFALSAPADPGERAGELRRVAGVSVELDERELAAVYRCTVNNARLMSRFEPRRFDGDLTFVTAALEREEGDPGWESWRPYVSGAVENSAVACAHLGMMRPEPLAEVAATVLRALRPGPGRGRRARSGPA